MVEPPTSRSEPSSASRDAGLARLARVRKSVAVGCVALVAGLAVFVAQAKPGKTSGGNPPAAGTPSNSGSTSQTARFAQPPLRASASASSAPSASAPAPPPAAPTPAPAAPPPAAVSGGS